MSIANVLVNDGKWHFAKAERYGKEASLILDDGEGFKMNYTFGLPNGAKEMDVDRDSIFLGAKVVQIKVGKIKNYSFLVLFAVTLFTRSS